MGDGKPVNEGNKISQPRKKTTRKKAKKKTTTRKKAKTSKRSTSKKKTTRKTKRLSDSPKSEMIKRGKDSLVNKVLNGFHVDDPERPEPSSKTPRGRPSEYDPSYCDDLIEHMSRGNAFESFGAYLYDKYGREYGVTRVTLYNWCKKYPEFLYAKEIGQQKSLDFYQNIGRRAMSGQLMRIKSEKPILDANGEITLDANGNVVIEREFESANFSSVPWKFTMKNIHGWRDNIEITGDDRGPIKSETKIDLTKLSTKELKVLADILEKKNES